MSLFLDNERVASRRVMPGTIVLSAKPVRIGQGRPRKPITPVRRNTFPAQCSFDGLIDEVAVFDQELAPDQIAKQLTKIEGIKDQVALSKRVLPAGEQIDEFGASYTHLRFYDSWDNLWCFGPYPDVVVGFDESPAKFVFWRGVSYIPMIVNEAGQWYSNEFNETWGTSGGDGCQEPMSDKGNYFTYAKILENSPARVVVQYRFPLADVNLVKANYVEETGWYDVADWYYTIYPDGIAVKRKRLWTSGRRNHEWQESMAIFGPDQHPEDIIEKTETVTMMNMEGSRATYNWTTQPPAHVDEPEGKCIQIVNYTGEYDPVTIGETFVGSNVYGGELTPYSVFPTWNHWPVAQMPSDGRYANFPDRTGHSSLTHVFLPIHDEADGDQPFYEKLLLEGMLDVDQHDLVALARSWNLAPTASMTSKGTVNYDKTQRAYVVETEERPINLTIEASENSPLYHCAMVINDWGNKSSKAVYVDGQKVDYRQGLVINSQGSKQLVVWVPIKSKKPVELLIK